MRNLIAAVSALLAYCLAAPAGATPRPGDEYEILAEYETSSETTDGSSSSSSGRSTLVERVIAVSDAGIELEYDLPKDSTADDRAREWRFPVRIFRPSSGPPRLLNAPQLEARLEDWLKRADWNRAMCGRWIFTWNAFRIECDPKSVISDLNTFDLRSSAPRDEALYNDPLALKPAPLTRTSGSLSGATFVAELAIDPEVVRRQQVESDIAVAEMTGRPLTREAAVRAHAAEQISGTMTVTIDTDPDGAVRKRTNVTKVTIRSPGVEIETRLGKQVVERRSNPPVAPR